MANSTKNPSELIDNIISFIKDERELYGDFTLSEFSSPKSQKAELIEENKPEDEIYDENRIYEAVENCTTLDELEALCRKTDFLKTDLENTKLIFGGVNTTADLMIIGEAP